MKSFEINRRDLLRAGAATIAAVTLGADRLFARPVGVPPAIQLYSVRDLLAKDLEGTLAKVREAGYVEVEAAGYYGRTAKEFRAAIDKAGLKLVSVHHALGQILKQEDELIQFGKDLGISYFVCPAPCKPDGNWGTLTLADWRWVTDQLNRLGEKIQKSGMTFGYHNHGPEFGQEAGITFYDEILRLTDPKLVKLEMDCGWVYYAGKNPVDFISKSPDRFPLLHIKDFVKGADGKFRNVVMGEGTGDWKAIYRAATGLKHAFIEQEEFDRDPILAIKQDAEFLKKLSI